MISRGIKLNLINSTTNTKAPAAESNPKGIGSLYKSSLPKKNDWPAENNIKAIEDTNSAGPNDLRVD
jgi:hypothetical protein